VNAAELTAEVLTALAPVADQLPDLRWRDAGEADRLTVRPGTVSVACPASTALDGDPGFVAKPVTVGPAASGAVLDRLLLGPTDPSRAGGATDPGTAFREVLAHPPEHWAWDWATKANRQEKALLSGVVSRRSAGIARMLGTWPAAGVTHAGRRPPWTHPHRPLRVTGAVDLTIGKRDGTHTIVLALTGDHAGATRDRLGYEAVVELLTLRRAPAVVRALLPDAGRDWSLTVDDDLLATGVRAVAAAARTALGVARLDAGGLPRTPSPACRRCAHQAGCEPGEAWLTGPGRLRLGFLPPA
jgi:hypothetical protein